MKQSRKYFHVRLATPALVIALALVASCLSAGVLARRGRVDGARALLPAPGAKRAQIDEHAAPALRAGMPALQSLVFEANEGQANQAIKFLARADGHELLLTSRSVIARSRKGSVAFSFAGASGVNVQGVDPLPGRRNYILGNDRNNWHTEIPTYRKVQYRDLYPGVDLEVYGNQSEFEYDFVVNPGASPQLIRLQIDRFTRARISKNGDLLLKRGDVELIQRKPTLYQDIDGDRRIIQ